MLLIKKLISITVLVFSLVFTFAGAADEEILTINDPVATYGEKILTKTDFEAFLDISNGLALDMLQTKASLKAFIESYVIYNDWAQQARVLGYDQAPEYIEKISVVDLLARINNSDADISPDLEKALLADAKNHVLTLSDEGLYFAGTEMLGNVSKKRFEADEELQRQIKLQYQYYMVLSDYLVKNNLDDPASYLQDKVWREQQLLTDLYIDHMLEDIKPTDDELDQALIAWKATKDFNQYKVKHIYAQDKARLDEAMKALEEKTLSFDEAVQEYSEDEQSKKNEGLISGGSWVTFPDINHPFYRALSELSAGEMSSAPFAGISGYHIAYLVEKRDSDIPDFYNIEAIKQGEWKAQQTKKLMDKWLEEVDIKIN